MSPDAPLLNLQDLRKTFKTGLADARPALDGLSLELAAGDFVLVIGSNGAGKSTMLNAVAGAISVDSGAVVLDGKDITRLAEHKRAGQIARVFQDPMAGTAAAMTVEENLALAERRGKSHRLVPQLDSARRAHYRDLLASLHLGLEARLTTPVAQLSGGQRQSLSLVMAVISAPRLLLLDEHTAALDPRTADLVMEATVAAIAQHGLTALMVTHNMQQAIQYGNRLLMMDAGRVRLDISGAAKSALTPQELVQRFKLSNDRMMLAET
ncbi:MAG: ATP-binding cassette domain-containing protein [Burkholderiaceae bacterium]